MNEAVTLYQDPKPSKMITAHAKVMVLPKALHFTKVKSATISCDEKGLHIKYEDGSQRVDIPLPEIRQYTPPVFTNVELELLLRGGRLIKIAFNDGQKSEEQIAGDIAAWVAVLQQNGIKRKNIFRGGLYVLFGFMTLLVKVFPVIGLIGIAGLIYLITTTIRRRK